jgi:hypothetical protein
MRRPPSASAADSRDDEAEHTSRDAHTTFRPLSHGQEGIELQHRAAAGSPIFNVPAAVELLGPLDRAALSESLSEIVRRHDVLRTTLGHNRGRSVAIVHAAEPIDLRVHDLRHLPRPERERTARALLDAESARPFDLDREAGLRCVLVVLGRDRHVLFWVMHHIVCDGWSKSVFARELSVLYGNYAAGEAGDLPPLRAGYGDFVHLQRRIAPVVLDRQLSYWRTRLAGVDQVVAVPSDHPRPVSGAIVGDGVDFHLDAREHRGLIALAHDNGATVFMVLHAALSALLHRIGGHDDIVVRVPYGGRASPDFEPLIGFFVNVLALRIDVGCDPDFRELLARVRATALDAYENSDVPFARVLDAITPVRPAPAGVQVSLAFRDLPYQDVHLSGLTVKRFALTRVDIRYDLELHMWEVGNDGGLGGRLLYRPDLFDRTTITTWVRAYGALVEAVLVAPDVPLSRLRLPLPPPRRATPPPVGEATAHPQPVAPETVTEAAVHELWVELLHFEDFGVHDDFLAIGGHSLLVAFMISGIRGAFGVDLSVSDVFRKPTIAAIAATVDLRLSGTPVPPQDVPDVAHPPDRPSPHTQRTDDA